MDVSEKDLARQKYRQSKKNSYNNHNRPQGRGRGKTEHISNKVESNSNPTNEEDVPDKDQEANTTPQRSQGADLLQLLKESEKYDPKVAFRARCNLSSIQIDSHPPPPPLSTSTANDTLSLDLNKLALYLSMLPLSTVLDTNLMHNDDNDDSKVDEEFWEQLNIDTRYAGRNDGMKEEESSEKIVITGMDRKGRDVPADIIDEKPEEEEEDDELDALLGLSDKHQRSGSNGNVVGAYISGTGDLTDFLDSL